MKLLDKLKTWLYGPRYVAGQRVKLVGGYPSDMAKTAHRRAIYGTVQQTTDYGDDIVTVKWDGFQGVRFMHTTSIAPYVDR